MSHKNDTSYQIISARNQKIKEKLPFLPYLFKYTIFQHAAANILCVFIYTTLSEKQNIGTENSSGVPMGSEQREGLPTTGMREM